MCWSRLDGPERRTRRMSGIEMGNRALDHNGLTTFTRDKIEHTTRTNKHKGQLKLSLFNRPCYMLLYLCFRFLLQQFLWASPEDR